MAAHIMLQAGMPMTPMTEDEKTFCQTMGARIARLRKECDLTQAQLGEALELSQQMIASYEVGRRRVPVPLLPKLARALATSVEELIGEEAKPGKRGPAPRLQQQMERIQRLSRPQQRFVMQMIDTVLQQAGQ